MSPPSPRRSSRATRTAASAQNPLTAASSTTSSGHNSAASNHRGSRGPKAQSPVKSEASVSRTAGEDDEDEEEDDAAAELEPPAPKMTRRSNRRQTEEHSDVVVENKQGEEGEVEDDEEAVASIVDEDGETTRCICGSLEFPGLPIDFTAASPGHVSRGSRHGITLTVTPDPVEEGEPGSMFIQCDSCQVWQHGGCVGIISEKLAQNDYFCEQCRPDMHSLHKNPAGQRYSRYLPLQKSFKSHRKMSLSKDGKDSLKVQLHEPAKRRSTMNSRSAYEEEEMLRKVLEESKVDGHLDASESVATSRKGKRARDESEDNRSDVKRQRINSSEPESDNSDEELPDAELQDEMGRKKQTPRGAAAKSQREKEKRERERERAEAANKRKGRADRRRGDEPEISEDRKPDISAASDAGEAAEALASLKKTANGRINKRRALPTSNASPAPSTKGNNHSNKESPKDPTGNDEAASNADSSSENTTAGALANGASSKPNNHHGHHRGRGANNHKEPTMSELRKRAAIMLEIVMQSRLESEHADAVGLRVGAATAIASFENGSQSSSSLDSPPVTGLQRESVGLGEGVEVKLRGWMREFLGMGTDADSSS